MDSTKLHSRKWTYADYLTWPDDERWELIYGMAYSLSYVSQMLHQRVVGAFYNHLVRQIDRKKYEVFIAPLNVSLGVVNSQVNSDGQVTVQPDIFVIPTKKDIRDCDCCTEIPRLIIEVTTSDTQNEDVSLKFDLYEQCGVKEYWIVYPTEQVLMVYVHDNEGFCKPTRYACSDKVVVNHLNNLVLDLANVFVE
jgi:Uma2 family endonuclease